MLDEKALERLGVKLVAGGLTVEATDLERIGQ
jgi:hypothetical protein